MIFSSLPSHTSFHNYSLAAHAPSDDSVSSWTTACTLPNITGCVCVHVKQNGNQRHIAKKNWHWITYRHTHTQTRARKISMHEHVSSKVTKMLYVIPIVHSLLQWVIESLRKAYFWFANIELYCWIYNSFLIYAMLGENHMNTKHWKKNNEKNTQLIRWYKNAKAFYTAWRSKVGIFILPQETDYEEEKNLKPVTF